MKNKYYFIFIVIIFMASYLLGNNIDYLNHKSDKNTEAALIKTSCDPTKETCDVSLAGYIVNYKILGDPSPLKKFKVELQSSQKIKAARVNFLMAGMDMGKNDYYLKNEGNNIWQREVILPICSLGRNNWINQLEIEIDNRYWLIEFYFEQKN